MKVFGVYLHVWMVFILSLVISNVRGGDWDSLNNLLKDVVFSIPDPGTFTAGTYRLQRFTHTHTYKTKKIGTFAWTDLKVTLTNIQVSKVSLVDLVLKDVVKTPGSSSSQREVDLTATLSSLQAHVNLDWKYKYGIISGSGKADASVTKGNAVVQMSVVSPNTDTPPSSASVLGCTMTLHLDATYVMLKSNASLSLSLSQIHTISLSLKSILEHHTDTRVVSQLQLPIFSNPL